MSNKILVLDEKTLSKTHDKKIEVKPGFMFKDLHGNPMLIKQITVVTWTPKK